MVRRRMIERDGRMSAYMVDRVHVDLLVDVAINGPRNGKMSGPHGYDMPLQRFDVSWYVPGDYDWTTAHTYRREARIDTAHEVGQMLVAANLASIHARYPDTLEGGPVPGPVDEYWTEPYRFARPRFRLTIAEALKALEGFEYQACEVTGWRETEAHAFCESLRASLINAWDEYRAAEWAWTAEKVAERLNVAELNRTGARA